MSAHKTVKASKAKARKVKSVDLDGFDEHVSSVDLKNKGKVVKLLTEMFVAGDHDAFMELLELYIDHVGKRAISKETKIPEKTIYNFKNKSHKTSSENIFKVMKAIAMST